MEGTKESMLGSAREKLGETLGNTKEKLKGKTEKTSVRPFVCYA